MKFIVQKDANDESDKNDEDTDTLTLNILLDEYVEESLPNYMSFETSEYSNSPQCYENENLPENLVAKTQKKCVKNDIDYEYEQPNSSYRSRTTSSTELIQNRETGHCSTILDIDNEHR